MLREELGAALGAALRKTRFMPAMQRPVFIGLEAAEGGEGAVGSMWGATGVAHGPTAAG